VNKNPGVMTLGNSFNEIEATINKNVQTLRVVFDPNWGAYLGMD
jgi:hypothetical protein